MLRPATDNPRWADVSSGELFAKPRYFWMWSSALTGASQNDYSEHALSRSSSIIPLSNSFGPSVGYTFVTETLQDGSRTIFKYSNISSAVDGRFIAVLSGSTSYPTPFDKFCERGYKRGRLIQKTSYDPDGGIIQSTGYQYRTTGLEDSYVLASNLYCVDEFMSTSHLYFTGGIYKLFYPKYDLTEECDTLFYPQGESTETVTSYDRRYETISLTTDYPHSADVGTLTKVTRKQYYHYTPSACMSESTEYTYPLDYTTALMQSLYKQDFCLFPVSETHYNGSKFIRKSETTYQNVLTGNGLHSLPQYYIETYPGNVRDTLVTCHSYTSTGTLSAYTRLGEPKTSLLWGHHDNYLLARVTGNAYSILPSLGSLVFNASGMKTAVKSYIQQFPGMMVTAYSYLPNGVVTSVITPNGNTTSYQYDNYGRLTEILDEDSRLLRQYQYNYRNR